MRHSSLPEYSAGSNDRKPGGQQPMPRVPPEIHWQRLKSQGLYATWRCPAMLHRVWRHACR
jgi:hypothetical protein